MSKPEDIISGLITQLKNSSYLSYVDDNLIFEGVRERITSFPAIVVEVLRDVEDENIDVGNYVDLTLSLGIIGFTKVYDKDNPITGNANEKGITDLRNDIAKAICSDRTIGGTAIWAKIEGADYEYFEDGAIRAVSMEVSITFRQNAKTRA